MSIVMGDLDGQAENTLAEALRRIAAYVEAEWHEGHKAFQVAIIARAALASLRESIPPRRMCGADHGDACDCLGSDPCTCGGGHTNVDGNGGHALGCPARAVASVCQTSTDAKADTQTPHNATRRDDAALGEAPKREVIYGGGFELGWLAEGETVSSAGDGTSAAIVTRANGEEVRLEIGDVFALAAAVPEAGKDAAG